MNVSGWIITREIRRDDVRYRLPSGRLTTERLDAEVFPSADLALHAAQEGDVIIRSTHYDGTFKP